LARASDIPMLQPLEISEYERSATVVARDLLGTLLVRDVDGQRLIGRIVETEAYISDIDEASHGYRGRTPRNASMFGSAGHAYVYRSYGIHMMLNVVTTHGGGAASAVLIRGMEPLAGLDLMRARRGAVQDSVLLRGPGNLCAALSIDVTLDGHDLTQTPMYIAHGEPPSMPIVTTTRIGISRSALLPWRFYVLGSPGVSRPDRSAEGRIAHERG
jgi:DNA-3-methyladenine glycosylase